VSIILSKVGKKGRGGAGCPEFHFQKWNKKGKKGKKGEKGILFKPFITVAQSGVKGKNCNNFVNNVNFAYVRCSLINL
jgi:hypothetical protein